MARLPKCPDCGTDIEDKKKAKKVSGRWVCLSCLEKREKIADDRQELYDLVAELFFLKYPTGMMMKQIKDFKDNLEYTYKGMTLSLVYWTETLGNSMSNAKGVGIIPYIYEDAKKFYIEKMNVKSKIDKMNGSFTSKKEVKITKRNTRNANKSNYKIIDMNDL